MLREEHQIDADEGQPEMHLADRLVVIVAEHLRKPIIPAAEDREDSTQREHIMEVGNDVIGVVQRAIDSRIGENDTGHSADGEEENEAYGPKHGRAEFN